jgi:hypothetical protein
MKTFFPQLNALHFLCFFGTFLTSVWSEETLLSSQSRRLLIGIEIDSHTFQPSSFVEIMKWIQNEFIEKKDRHLFACIYNSKVDSPLYKPKLFQLLEEYHLEYFFPSRSIPILCSFEHPNLEQYDGLLQISANAKPPSFPTNTLPNLMMTSQLDHFYFNATFIPAMKNFTKNFPFSADRNSIASRLKQFISSKEFLPSSISSSNTHRGTVTSTLPTRANSDKYHTSGVCNLWWPLNQTEIFVFVPEGSEFAKPYHHIERILLICPQLPSTKPFTHFNSLEEPFLFVLEQFDPSVIRKSYDRIGDRAIEVGLMDLVGKEFISRPFELRLNMFLEAHETARRLRIFMCPTYAPEIAHLRKKALSRMQSRMKDLQSERSCFSSFEVIVNIVRPPKPINSVSPPPPPAPLSLTSPHPSPILHPMLGNIHSRDIFGYVLTSLGYTSGTMVEIGVNRGHYSSLMLSQWPGKCYVMIDPWEPHPGNEYVDVANLNTRLEHENVFQEALTNTANFGNRPIILRNTSVNAAKYFVNSSVDIVYIDGLHHYQGVWDDIVAWWPKLRSGGIMAGHDYMHEADGGGTIFTVKPAVDEFARKMNLMIYHTQDSYPTWFCFKV